MPVQSSLQIASKRVVSLWYVLPDIDAAWNPEQGLEKGRIEIELVERFISLRIDSLIIGDLRSDVGDFRRGQADVKPVKLLVLDSILANCLEGEGEKPAKYRR